MRIYVSSNFYDYTHIIIYFLIIRKYYNPIFYDYAHILNGFWIYLQGGFYMSMHINGLIRTEIYWMQMVLQVWMLLARVHHGINLQMYLKIIVKKCLIMWSGNLFRKKAASHLNILLMICRLDFWHWYRIHTASLSNFFTSINFNFVTSCCIASPSNTAGILPLPSIPAPTSKLISSRSPASKNAVLIFDPPTTRSLPYACAVSIWRYPAATAALAQCIIFAQNTHQFLPKLFN